MSKGKSSERRRRTEGELVDAKQAVDLATAQPENVFLFIPNLIGQSRSTRTSSSPVAKNASLSGYSRVILAGVALHYMSYHPKYCTLAYGISCLLDAVDGHAARALGQTSKFGAVLDMVTDRCVFRMPMYRSQRAEGICRFRCTTSCLLCYLASAYPDYAILFQFLIALDFSSHYMHMYRCVVSIMSDRLKLTSSYSSLATGSRSHKTVTSDVSRILWLYYNDSVSREISLLLHLLIFP